jgi:phosphoserine aminotransferase
MVQSLRTMSAKPDTTTSVPDIKIPSKLLPKDGRFGSGPSKVRPEAIKGLSDIADTYMGTSHRQATVKKMVERLRTGMRELFDLPEGYEVVLGNGGTTVFWDALTFGFVEKKSQHLSFGEFSSKFAKETQNAPFLDDPEIIKSDTGTRPQAIARPDVDTYALTHNETSTGVMCDILRPDGADGLVVVDATSGAGGLRVDPSQFDVYYFAPQKCFASDGGLWIALMSPAAIERAQQVAASDRWIPESISITTALTNSLANTTYNTPALATIYMTVNQVEWMNSNGGLEFAASRSDKSSETIYSWAERTSYTTPFVAKPDERSHVTCTIDLAENISFETVCKVLRNNGIVDTDPYRKLGRNQVRIATFPAVEPDDIDALTKCIDYVVENLG